MTNTRHVIDTLRTELKTNKALDATLHLCAVRKRARSQMTLDSLYNKLKAEHYDLTRDQVASVLPILAQAGIGRLETGRNGKPKALKDIKIKLQSLGHSVLTSGPIKLESYHKKIKYAQFLTSAQKKPLTVPMLKALEPESFRRRAIDRTVQRGVSIQITINGKLILIPVPANLTVEDVAALVVTFQTKGTSIDEPSNQSL